MFYKFSKKKDCYALEDRNCAHVHCSTQGQAFSQTPTIYIREPGVIKAKEKEFQEGRSGSQCQILMSSDRFKKNKN